MAVRLCFSSCLYARHKSHLLPDKNQLRKEKGWQSSFLGPLLLASITTRGFPMASTAYARIGGRGKSELRAVGLLRLFLCLGSSLIPIPKLENPNATGIRSTKREDRFPIPARMVCEEEYGQTIRGE